MFWNVTPFLGLASHLRLSRCGKIRLILFASCTYHCLARKIKFLFRPHSVFNICFRSIEPHVRRKQQSHSLGVTYLLTSQSNTSFAPGMLVRNQGSRVRRTQQAPRPFFCDMEPPRGQCSAFSIRLICVQMLVLLLEGYLSVNIYLLLMLCIQFCHVLSLMENLLCTIAWWLTS